MAKCEEHKFYCLNCGKEGIPLRRKLGFQHKSFHRKKMFCPWCGQEVNHIEVRNLEEERKFKEDFSNGVYLEEAKESIAICKGEN
jgi:uncharacterized Zn ribbon protein